MLIVQISDMHCGRHSEFKLESLKTAIQEINDLRPDVVLVTGDITHQGYLPEFKLASEYLSKIECEKKIFGVGNHDFRHTGYLLSSKFFPRPDILEIDDVVIAYISTARPDKDEGEVGYRQIQGLKGLMQRRYKKKFKVFALHHHLIPIPDTGLERTTVVDAGDILKGLMEADADLILCGHRHRPWSFNLETMRIIHAGSVSSERCRGFFANSYNLIEIKGGRIRARLKVVGGEVIDFKEVLTMETYIPD